MPRRAPFKTIDDYELFVNETLGTWSPVQRTALAASMAERWLPAYAAFSNAEDWGDAPALGRMLVGIWAHVAGRPLDAASVARFQSQLHDATPHTDDFDAPEALAAAVILAEALRCCARPDNLPWALGATLSGFEAVAPDWSIDPDEQPRLWTKSVIRTELEKQLAVIEAIGGIAHFGDDVVAALRRRLTGDELAGVVPRRKEPKGPLKLSNQTLFEQYRRMVEADIRGTTSWTPPPELGVGTAAMMKVTAWSSRYSRRLQTIDGSYGAWADTRGQQALVAWQKARDAATPGMPVWHPEVRAMVDLMFTNATYLDVRALDQPHRYGPSLRRLWLEAKARGESDDAAWESVVAWGRHRPDCWATEDSRKKKGRADTTALGERLGRAVAWASTGDPLHPWAADVDGHRWRVGLSDFPDDYLYGLQVGDDRIGSFHDWPDTWSRE